MTYVISTSLRTKNKVLDYNLFPQYPYHQNLKEAEMYGAYTVKIVRTYAGYTFIVYSKLGHYSRAHRMRSLEG